jgi:hypothetical protein
VLLLYFSGEGPYSRAEHADDRPQTLIFFRRQVQMPMRDWSYSPTNHLDYTAYEGNIFKLDENDSACFIPDNGASTSAGQFDYADGWKTFSLPQMLLLFHQRKTKHQIPIETFKIVHAHMCYFKVLIRARDLVIEGNKIDHHGLLYCTICKQVLECSALGHLQQKNGDGIHSNYMNELYLSLNDLRGVEGLKITKQYLFKELFDPSWKNLKIGDLTPTDHPIPYIKYYAGINFIIFYILSCIL